MLGPEYTKENLVAIVADMEFTVSQNPASTYTTDILEAEFKRASSMVVTEIDFSRKLIDTIPTSLNSIVKLRKLILNDCKIKNLPSEKFADLTSLRIVELKVNNLTKFPVCFALPSVEILLIDHNQIVDVPADAMSALTGLKSLSMFANKLKSFPSHAVLPPTLRKMDLACNFIKTLDFGETSFTPAIDLSIDPNVKTPNGTGATPIKFAPKRAITPKTPGSPKPRAAPATAPKSPRSPAKLASVRSPTKKKRKSLSDADLGFSTSAQAQDSDDEDYKAPRAKRSKIAE